MPVRGLAAIISGAFVLGLGAVPASATTLTASSILGEFNAVVFNNVSGSCCDFEGPVVVGGNLSGAGTFFNQGAAGLPAGYGTVNVFGTASGGFNANGAQIYVAGADSATFSGATVHNGYGFADPFSAFQAPLVALSHCSAPTARCRRTIIRRSTTASSPRLPAWSTAWAASRCSTLRRPTSRISPASRSTWGPPAR
jgi:choice-of-anchor A domain-containing protein